MPWIPLDKLTIAQLRFRIDWNVSFAQMFDRKNEPRMSRNFLDTANRYADELERRENPPVETLIEANFSTVDEAALFISTEAGCASEWRLILRDPDARTTLYRAAAKKLHPDSQTGSHAAFLKLQSARELLDCNDSPTWDDPDR